MDIKDISSGVSADLLAQHAVFTKDNNANAYLDTDVIVDIIKKIRMAMFPGYFSEIPEFKPLDVWLQCLLADIHQELAEEIKMALIKQNRGADAGPVASEVSAGLIGQLADIQRLLYKDAQAGFDGDPAAKSVDEVIFTYPGFFAISVYRIAHCLFVRDVPVIPRLMSEHAHSVTGIDIHPGAQIGEYFFIDHGTGVVIGETTVIGSHVKLYQGVTLGALSTKSGQKLAGIRRHPTIQDNVTIYSGASILGGETVIGRNSTVGGNMFITKSVPEGTTVR